MMYFVLPYLNLEIGLHIYDVFKHGLLNDSFPKIEKKGLELKFPVWRSGLKKKWVYSSGYIVYQY